MVLQKFSRTLKIALALIVTLFSSGLLPTATAYAEKQSDGTAQPVWCQFTSTWTAQQGSSSTNPNRTALKVLPPNAPDDMYIDSTTGQVLTPNSSFDAMKGALDTACATQQTLVVPVPLAPETVDPCNAGDVTNNVTWKESLPTSTSSVTWMQSNDGATRTATLVGTNVKWDDNTTTPKVFNLPADKGEMCEVPITTVSIPVAPETVDPCNAQGVTSNVSWKDAMPLSTETVAWSESNSGATRTATLIGTNVKWEDNTTAPKVFNLPADEGEMCEVPPVDVCRNVDGVQTQATLDEYGPNVFIRGNGNCVVTICHRTNAVKNPYREITVSLRAVDGMAGNSGNQPDHYGEHLGPVFDPVTMENGDDWGDIIPPNPLNDGRNWNEEGQAIYENHCKVTQAPNETEADITFTSVCTNEGVKVTLTNDGDKDGSAIVNGERFDVPANNEVEVLLDFVLGTPFQTEVSVTIDGETSTETVNCAPGQGGGEQGGGEILGESTSKPTPTGHVLGTTLPETLPATGGANSPLAIIIASLMAYGAAYFLQGRRKLHAEN